MDPLVEADMRGSNMRRLVARAIKTVGKARRRGRRVSVEEATSWVRAIITVVREDGGDAGDDEAVAGGILRRIEEGGPLMPRAWVEERCRQ